MVRYTYQFAFSISANQGIKRGFIFYLGSFKFSLTHVFRIEISSQWLFVKSIYKWLISGQAIPKTIIYFCKLLKFFVFNLFKQFIFITISFSPKQIIHNISQLNE